MFSRKIYLSTKQNRPSPPKAVDPVITPALDGGYGWVIVLSSFICNMIVDGIPSSFGVFIGSFAYTFKEDEGTVVTAQCVNVGMHLMVGPVVGALCKRYSCRAVCIAGSIVSTTAFVLSMFATNTLMFTLMYGILGGVGFGMIYISTVILVSYYFELQRTLAVSISICGSGFGTFVFSPLSSHLLLTLSWQGAHLIFAFFTLSCIVFSLLLVPLEFFRLKTPSSNTLAKAHKSCLNKAKTCRPRRSQVWYQDDALCSIFEDRNAENERNKVVEYDTNIEKNEDRFSRNASDISTCEFETVTEQRDLRRGQVLHLSMTKITETANLKGLENVSTNLNGLPSGMYINMPACLATEAQQHRKKEILKILLFTRIVLKKDCSSRTRLPLFSKKIINAMKSLGEMSSETGHLEYDVLDFYEIKKSKSEDLTLLQHYLSHVELNFGESLPSDLNHYAYIVNDVGFSIRNQLEDVSHTCIPVEELDIKDQTTNDYVYDAVVIEQVEDDDENFIYAANGRNVKSLPFLDRINNGYTCLRETQSSRTQSLGGNDEEQEHVRFVTNLFSNTSTTGQNQWTTDDFETNSDYSFQSNESVMKRKATLMSSAGKRRLMCEDIPVENTREVASRDGNWWNSSSSVRKDMYYTGSISNLREYQERGNGEAYRKQNTVEVSILYEMWDKDLLCNRVFILYILANVFLLAGYYIPHLFLVASATARGIDSTKAAYLMSAVGLSNMLGRIFFGFLDSWKLIDSLLLNNISLIVTAVCVLAFPHCSNFRDYFITSVVFGFSQACVVCLTTTLLVQYFSLDKLTNSFGILQLFRGIAIMVGVPCGGSILRWTQSYLLTFYVSVGFYVLSVLFSFLMQYAVRESSARYHKVSCTQETPAKDVESCNEEGHTVTHVLMNMPS